MTSRLVAVRFETPDPETTAAFWAAVLGRQVVPEPEGMLVPGDATQVGLRFVAAASDKTESNRLHLHLTSSSVEDQRRTVEVVQRAGGRRRGTRPLPFGDDIYLADPGGDEFCVIEPGNAYLDGCGPLGEVTCEGTPAAGRFWLAALDWSLVWDQDEQIAIQSPTGGTKIAWDGPADPASPRWRRQRFDLVTADPDREIERLVRLGARLLDAEEDVRLLTDPDGTVFSLTAG